MIDYHLHTNMTVDSNMTAVELAKKAKEIGLHEICITNHQDWADVASKKYHYASTEEDWDRFLGELKDARQILPIKFGLELGYWSEHIDSINRFAQSRDFDFILGSIHIMRGKIISAEKPHEDIENVPGWYKSYFKRLKEMIENMNFDCIGHFDIVKKSAPFLDFKHYKTEVLQCINAMRKKGVGFELNTMGWNHDCNDCYPSPEILKMLYDAGITKVTIGSDSHEPRLIGTHFERGIKLLKEIGYRKICTFDKRKEKYISF